MSETKSVAAFLAAREQLPVCHVLVMNSIWDRFEERRIVALFDTEAMADAYEFACLLPRTEWVTMHGRRMAVHYREGTLLREFNKPDHDTWGPHIVSAPLHLDYDGIPINPEPPPC